VNNAAGTVPSKQYCWYRTK